MEVWTQGRSEGDSVKHRDLVYSAWSVRMRNERYDTVKAEDMFTCISKLSFYVPGATLVVMSIVTVVVVVVTVISPLLFEFLANPLPLCLRYGQRLSMGWPLSDVLALLALPCRSLPRFTLRISRAARILEPWFVFAVVRVRARSR
ncbi:hypothetical protein K435DRAFT_301221 [Dendrothele bispora CBS 962.96]|uniref:Uncharacterized protein n=1 Tax=Dendrothele bispora (strain CBS 962.96) TaxID=1314807 RepID=A0A4S8KII1_DENBC|nr:hypothetical protein K435DRAFT_301221 [Dendrothele bispora CBS 962.96]